MNKINLIGNLTRDPEKTQTASGIEKCVFTLAVTRPWNRDETDFIRCVAWKKKAETIGQYVFKGNKLAVSGYLQTGKYEKDGVTHYTSDVNVEDFEFLTPKGHSEPQDKGMSDIEPLDDPDSMPF
jgi:single-strand DNA-binding protein